MSVKRQSGSDESLAPKGQTDSFKQGEFRPRASTLPTDVVRAASGRAKTVQEEQQPHQHSNGSRRQAWTAKIPTEEVRKDSNGHHDDRNGYSRARTQTMPSERMRSPPTRDPLLNHHVAALSRASKGQSVHWASDEQLVDSTEHYINRCISIYSDESLAVQRDPLPKGSLVYEGVLHKIEREKTVLLAEKENKSQNGIKKKTMRTRSMKTQSPANSPILHRHIIWKSASARK